MGCCFAKTLVSASIIAACGCAFELLLRFGVGIAAHIERRKHLQGVAAHEAAGMRAETFINPNSRMLAAYNIEHMVERTAAFVTVVLGESVVSLLFIARPGSIGLSDEYARAVFGLTVAFIINAVYFDAALSRKFVHAIRRHVSFVLRYKSLPPQPATPAPRSHSADPSPPQWLTHILWDTLHFPLCAALILASASLQKMVASQDVTQAIRWQYGGGIGVTLVCITCIGLAHQSLEDDEGGKPNLSVNARAALRIAVALFAILLPLAKSIRSTTFLGVYVGVLSAMVIVEVWGKLGKELAPGEDPLDNGGIVDDEIEEERSEARDRTEALERESGCVPRQVERAESLESK